MRSAALLSLLAAGCLDAPPEAVIDPDLAALVLAGVDGHDRLSLEEEAAAPTCPS